jgi:hypothetical protein
MMEYRVFRFSQKELVEMALAQIIAENHGLDLWDIKAETYVEDDDRLGLAVAFLTPEDSPSQVDSSPPKA